MPDFDLLGSLAKNLHQEFVRIYYLLLPVFFALSLVMAWFKSPAGGPDFINTLKRAVVSTLLLVAFPDVADAILLITDGITEKIESMSGIDAVLKMAKEKSEGYTLSPTSLLIQFNDLIIATLSFLSYIVLYVARYVTIAMYHFYWIFFLISAPLLLLFNLFEGTSVVAKNLFKGMIEVASWKVAWSILGAMLTALAYGDAYKADGNYLTVIVMNFVIAYAMFKVPAAVSSLSGSGFHSTASSFQPFAIAATLAAPAKLAAAEKIGKKALSDPKGAFQEYVTRSNNTSKFRR